MYISIKVFGVCMFIAFKNFQKMEELIVDDIPIFEKIFIARVCLCGTSDIRT